MNYLGQFRNHKVVYRRYAGLFFSFCVDANDNELVWLEAIHLFVEILGQSLLPTGDHRGRLLTITILVRRADQFFGNVTELVSGHLRAHRSRLTLHTS